MWYTIAIAYNEKYKQLMSVIVYVHVYPPLLVITIITIVFFMTAVRHTSIKVSFFAILSVYLILITVFDS